MKQVKLTILGRTPSKKNTHRNLYSKKLRRWIIAADSKTYYWENQAILQLIHQKNKLKLEAIAGKIHVKFIIYLATFRRKDLTNVIQSCEDALEKANIIETDFQIESMDGSRRILGVPTEEERADITIKDFKE